MKSLGLSYFTDTQITLIGLILFFLSFLLLIGLHFYALRGKKLHQLSHLPFEGEEHG